MLVKAYFDATSQYWEAIYQRETLFSAIYKERLRAALACVDELAIEPGATALDIGCGPGLGTTGLAWRGLSVDAVDTSEGMVTRTLARARRQGVEADVRGRVGDIHALPFEDGRFDLVFVVGVSEWLSTLDGPLEQIARVLAPGGHLVLTSDNSWALSCLLDPLQHPLIVPLKRALGAIPRLLIPDRRPLRTYARSSRAMVAGLRRAGLTPLRHQTLGFGPFTLFNRPIVPDAAGQSLDRTLTALARVLPPLRGGGLVHLHVARKAP